MTLEFVGFFANLRKSVAQTVFTCWTSFCGKGSWPRGDTKKQNKKLMLNDERWKVQIHVDHGETLATLLSESRHLA